MNKAAQRIIRHGDEPKNLVKFVAGTDLIKQAKQKLF